MDREPTGVREYMRDREVSHLLGPVKVAMRESLPDLQVGSACISEAVEGRWVELPRWVGEALEAMGFGEVEKSNTELELFKAVHRERIQGPAQLSPLPHDFYIKLRAYLKGLKDPAKLAKARASAHDLLTLRIGKILDLTATTSLPPGVEERLTPEELYLYRRTLALVEEFRRGVVEG